MMNKSLLTNLGALGLIGAGMVSPIAGQQLLSTGYFAFAGALTNWIAIHMLFEKIPLLYGSGVIPARFEEFKHGIRRLIMGQFFTRENIGRFFEAHDAAGAVGLNAEALLEVVDREAIYGGLVSVVKGSSFGGMLNMVGGEAALAPLKEPFMAKVEELIRSVLESDKLKSALDGGRVTEEIVTRIEAIVTGRLDELTPQLVKEIVQEMIQRHLGWLVVWGGVFGGLIGLVTSFIL